MDYFMFHRYLKNILISLQMYVLKVGEKKINVKVIGNVMKEDGGKLA